MPILPASVFFATSGFPQGFPAASLSLPLWFFSVHLSFLFPYDFSIKISLLFLFKIAYLLTHLLWVTPPGPEVVLKNVRVQNCSVLQYFLSSAYSFTASAVPRILFFMNFVLDLMK